MHAIRQYEFGPAENLRYEQVADPVPDAGQVRIAVEASGVHLIDTVIRRGVQRGPYPLPELPMTPGREVSGVVDSAGSGAESWSGRRVVAHLGQASGGYAERAVAPAGALHEIPDGMAADVAVAMIGTGRTAVGILELAELTPADVVLVTAAAGGLGALFVQAAERLGATAVGLAGGPAKIERVRALGASLAVDYLQPGWPDRVREALRDRLPTVALDGVGGALGRAVAGLLADGGRLVRFGSLSGEAEQVDPGELAARGIAVVQALGRPFTQRPGGMRDLEATALANAAKGLWTPLVQRFPLARADAAHTAIETRATVGKVVLVP
ncbi:MAG TPA: zinc-binding dehydrogenase [Jatrophihabitantaceae bacterium]|jgi:NADPH2:quinone reductase